MRISGAVSRPLMRIWSAPPLPWISIQPVAVMLPLMTITSSSLPPEMLTVPAEMSPFSVIRLPVPGSASP